MDSVSLVACISDFGSEDFYAGAMRGVLAGALPRGSVVDVTQNVPAGDVRRAGLILWEAQPSFPKGTVFLAVVDPGVGGSRRAAVFHFPECDVVCPDNGIATFLMERFPEYQAVEIDPRRIGVDRLSNTFHGRDLFAPAAARLASGTNFDSLGPAFSTPHRLSLPRLQGEAATGWEGEALYSDHFGNIITSIGRIGYDFRELSPWIETGARGGTIHPHSRVELGDGSTIPVGTTYSDAHGGPRRIAVVGSNGLLEIAAWQAAADAGPFLRPGSAIRLIPPA